jgi:hypothetical protein
MWSIHLLQPGQALPDGDIEFLADVESQLLGADPKWDRVAVVRDEIGGGGASIVMVGEPLPTPPFPPGIVEPDWHEVAHPPSAADPAVMVLHVIQFAEAAAAAMTPSEMEQYTSHAAKVAGPAGCRVAAWFAVTETPVGDGRTWHQARFNAFPSKAAFMAVVFDPDRIDAQKAHREVAIADTYTMILRPTVGAPTNDFQPFQQ